MRSPAWFILVCSVALTACSAPAAQQPYVEVSAATIAASDNVPSPNGDVVVTVAGAVSKSNSGSSIELDIATLEAMGLVKYSVHDPWLNEDLEFTGVLLSAFIDAVGVSPDATTLRFHAIDDYEVDLSIADVRRWPILLATQTDGQPMGLEDKGPTRVVFPYDQFPEIDQLTYKDLWIWQITSITVS